MTPRKYTMDKRKAAVEETRRRIVEATLALHAEKGAFGTSWQDIAKRADVSVGTVYKHFPSLDELVPACGELVFAISRPPSLEDAPQIFAGASSLEERLGRLVSEFFDFYERGEPYLEIDFQERQLPAVQEWEAHMRATREGLARESLRPLLEPEERTVRALSALIDFPFFKSFRRHDVSKAEAEEIVKTMLLCWIGGTGGGRWSVALKRELGSVWISPSGNRPIRVKGKEQSMNEEVAAKAYGLREGEGEARWWLGGLATIKATSKETGGHYTLVEVLEPEGEAPLHVHHREDEAFWVLEGEVTFQIGDETIEASAGSFVFGPRDVPHTFTVHSGPARILFLLSPAGFEEFIYATSEPAKERTLPPAPEGPPSEAEMEQLGALARQYGSELLV